jgi:hypothetical protein
MLFLRFSLQILWIICLSLSIIERRLHLNVSDKLPLELWVLQVFQELGTIDIGQFDLLDTEYPVRLRGGGGL